MWSQCKNLAENLQRAKTGDKQPVPYEQIESKTPSVHMTKNGTFDEGACLEARLEVSCCHYEITTQIGPSTKFEESENRERDP